MPVRHALIALLLTASAAIRGAEEPKPFLHPLFTDHMVLQRDAKVPVWGWTTPGAKVSIEIAGAKADAIADAQGKWSATTGPFPAGGPFELTATSGARTEKVADILMGDVWLCSGQSKMEMGIGAAKDAEKEIAAADYPKIRLFTVTKRIATTPVDTVVGSWQKTDGTTYIYLLAGSFLLHKVDAQTTEVQLMEHLAAYGKNADSAESFLQDMFSSVTALSHDQPLPKLK